MFTLLVTLFIQVLIFRDLLIKNVYHRNLLGTVVQCQEPTEKRDFYNPELINQSSGTYFDHVFAAGNLAE
jgi:hypothetical protein